MLNRLVVSLVLLLLLAPASIGGEENAWEEFDAVPAWVLDPPVREGMISAVDVGLSNMLSLAYDPDRVPRDRLNLTQRIERRLRRLLGDGAQAPALAGAEAATVVRKGFHHKKAADSRVVGGQTYYAFVLWETPLDVVLGAIPEAQRPAALIALRARVPHPTWQEVETEPTWVTSPPAQKGMFLAVAAETADRVDVARAVSELRGLGHVGWQIRARLSFHVGMDLASDIADEAIRSGRMLQRACLTAQGKTWALWAVPVERILDRVPEATKSAAEKALGEPIPARPWKWVKVEAQPAWVDQPPKWPDHLPYVQAVSSALLEVAKKQSIHSAEDDIREDLLAILAPVVGRRAAEPAAAAGAKRRQQGAHAFLEPGQGSCTAWTLWHIPVAKVLETLDAKHHAAARAALLP